jgi:hypothetical protein
MAARKKSAKTARKKTTKKAAKKARKTTKKAKSKKAAKKTAKKAAKKKSAKSASKPKAKATPRSSGELVRTRPVVTSSQLRGQSASSARESASGGVSHTNLARAAMLKRLMR